MPAVNLTFSRLFGHVTPLGIKERGELCLRVAIISVEIRPFFQFCGLHNLFVLAGRGGQPTSSRTTRI